MRRKIMTAFVCAIMTISVIPVYADDTQTDQAVTTEVSTETAATVQETKRTQSKEQQKKKTTSKKHTKTKKTKSKKKEENKVIPMPTQVISKYAKYNNCDFTWISHNNVKISHRFRLQTKCYVMLFIRCYPVFSLVILLHI